MSPEIPRDAAGRVIRPRPSQLLADVMDKLGPDHLTTRTLMAALIERDRGAGVEPRAVTPGYGWHLPVLADPPNVPYDLQETALDVEATVGQHDTAITANTAAIDGLETTLAQLGLAGYRIEVGSVVPTANASGVTTTLFAKPFASKPVVLISPGDSSGLDPARTVYVYHSGGTAAQFQVAGVVPNIPIRLNYIAVGPAVPVLREGEAREFITIRDEPDTKPGPS